MPRITPWSTVALIVGALLLGCDESAPTALSAALGFASVQHAPTGGTLVAHFTDKTDCANVLLSTGSTSGFLELCQDNSRSNSQTFLTYSIVDCTNECITLEAGAGFIPNGDFQGSGTAQEHLNTNTSAAVNPAFARYVGNGGPITLIWQKSDASTERHSGGGTSQLVVGDLRQETSTGGTYVVHSATAQGTIITFVPAPGNTAFMSANRTSSVTVQRAF